MHDYKIAALWGLARPFREAGRTFGEAVFAAGIGNKLNDAVAYKAAGIPGDFIFIIDSDSNLQVCGRDSCTVGRRSAQRKIAENCCGCVHVLHVFALNSVSGRFVFAVVQHIGRKGDDGVCVCFFYMYNFFCFTLLFFVNKKHRFEISFFSRVAACFLSYCFKALVFYLQGAWYAIENGGHRFHRHGSTTVVLSGCLVLCAADLAWLIKTRTAKQRIP